MLQTYCVRKNNRDAILACILKMIQTYKSRSVFNVVTIEADGAFQSVKHELQAEPYNIALTTCDADRHVETVERQIRFLKERIRSVRMMMPYKRIPERFTIEMVHRVTMLINSLPKQNGIHLILSPSEIVTGKKFRCPSIFESYSRVTRGVKYTCGTRLSCLIIVVGYPLSDIEVARPKLEYGIFRITPIEPTKINHSLI
jgi:hypothetical protein